jgi:hypothetical protein
MYYWKRKRKVIAIADREIHMMHKLAKKDKKLSR